MVRKKWDERGTGRKWKGKGRRERGAEIKSLRIGEGGEKECR